MADFSITLVVLDSTGTTARLLGRRLVILGLRLDLDAECSNLLVNVIFIGARGNSLVALSGCLGGRGLVIILGIRVGVDGSLLALEGALADGSLLLGSRAARGRRSGCAGA